MQLFVARCNTAGCQAVTMHTVQAARHTCRGHAQVEQLWIWVRASGAHLKNLQDGGRLAPARRRRDSSL